eukprot:5138575-Prymnesium_polylepis.1
MAPRVGRAGRLDRQPRGPVRTRARVYPPRPADPAPTAHGSAVRTPRAPVSLALALRAGLWRPSPWRSSLGRSSGGGEVEP